VVLSVEGEEVIYSEIDVRSNQLANLLRQRGVASSSRVGICLPRSIDAYIALLAIHKAGGRYVQLNPKFPREQIRHMLNDAKLAAIVTDSELGVREEEVGIPLIFLDRWREADAESSTEQWGHDKPVPDRDVCFIIYSSSTTERPKGVAVEPRMKLQKLRSLVSQQNGFGLQALTLFGRRIEGFLGAA
jgi:non-ribosomal peptide synthetase component F